MHQSLCIFCAVNMDQRPCSKKCCIVNCQISKRIDKDRHLYRFPKGAKTYICDKHFPREFCNKKTIKPENYSVIENILKKENIYPHLVSTTIIQSTKKKTIYRECVLKHCKNSKQKNVCTKLFAFPQRGSELFNTWVLNCGLSEKDAVKKTNKICEKHFHTHDVLKNSLRKGCVPLFNLSANLPQPIVHKPDEYVFSENSSLPSPLVHLYTSTPTSAKTNKRRFCETSPPPQVNKSNT